MIVNGLEYSREEFDGQRGFMVLDGVRTDYLGRELEKRKYTSIFNEYLYYDQFGFQLTYLGMTSNTYWSFHQIQKTTPTMNIINLDACRNNPYARSFRSVDLGLAQPESAPTGSIIAFATAPGKTASDGNGENGLYTQELIKAMRQKELSIEQVFKKVRINVLKLSDEKQSPWENSSLTGDFYFNPN